MHAHVLTRQTSGVWECNAREPSRPQTVLCLGMSVVDIYKRELTMHRAVATKFEVVWLK